MRRAARRPLREELGLPARRIDGDRDAVHEQPVALDAEAALAALERPRGDARQQPFLRAREVGHAGGAVVQHDGFKRGASARQCLEHRQAGVGGGEHIDLCRIEPAAHALPVRCVVKALGREAPAGQRLGITVHDGDAPPADIDAAPHRQRLQRAREGRGACGGGAQPRHDLVRVVHHRITHPRGVGATAAGVGVAGVVGHEFGLDIAARRVEAEHRRVDGGEGGVVHIEPVEVAVEHEPLRAALTREEFEHAGQGLGVAVQPTHDIEHLAVRGCRCGEHRRGVAVVQRATAPRGGGVVHR